MRTLLPRLPLAPVGALLLWMGAEQMTLACTVCHSARGEAIRSAIAAQRWPLYTAATALPAGLLFVVGALIGRVRGA